MGLFDAYCAEARAALAELLEAAGLRHGDLLVVGGSTSEVLGSPIGTNSVYSCALAIVTELHQICRENGLFLAVQCCEHLNRALAVEREAAERYGLEQVCAVPAPKAGGSFATAAFSLFAQPVLAERVQAHAGLDIGNTLIGMHLRPVAVPVRTRVKKIGEANVTAARTRPKLIGGERAVYVVHDPGAQHGVYDR